ncbi:MAG TPA: hydroxyisourate hydrolase [Ktedonobacteraceae bacterium]|nr:hydroxyisourate hydrolase [Ktedonobacteraceae bacterium]
MPGRLTTHVLDILQGRPAAHMTIQLWRLDAVKGRLCLKTTRTNANGRTEEALLVDNEMVQGTYELLFAVGAYFAMQPLAIELPEPPFLDEVPIRFGIADPQAHYHVPLLVSPWAYSTYRGS